MSWPKVKLSELLTETIGGYWGSASDEDDVNVYVVRNGDINDGAIDFDKIPLRGISKKQFQKASVEHADLIITTSGDCGKVAYVDAIPKPTIVSNFVKILRVDKSIISSKFLYYYLISAQFKIQLPSFIRGTTMPNLSLSRMAQNIKVPTPPLNEQERIANILDKIFSVKKNSDRVAATREKLLLSTFYEIFHSNQNIRSNWPIMKIEQLALQRKNSMRTGPFGSNLLHSEFVEEGIPVLGIDNVVDNVFKWKKERYITEEKYHSLKRYTVFPGDLLVTIMGTVGRTAVCPDDLPVCINTKHLACITLNQEMVHPLFLSYSLRHDQEIITQIKLKNRGAIMDGLNLTLIKSLKLAIPPIELQLKFVKVMNTISNFGEINKFADDASLSLAQEMLT